jgi:hypothetical protein
MTNEELTERIEAFRRTLANHKRGEPWYALASRLEEAMSGASAIGYGDDVVKKIASEATGLSSGVLTRYVAVLRKLKAAAAASGLNLSDLLAPGFNAVETAARLYETSPGLGLQALKLLADGRAGLTDVKFMSAQAPAPTDARSRTMRHRGIELQMLDRALRKQFEGCLVQRRPPSDFFRHTGWEIRDSDGRCIRGVDALIASKNDTAAEVETILASAALLSSYFPEFFFAVSANSPPSMAEEAILAIKSFQLDWIGVMVLSEDGTFSFPKDPRGRPVPDRSGSYESLRAELMSRRARPTPL